MTAARRGWTSTLILVLLATAFVPSSARAQDACPSASAPDAEAGWAAYQAGDMSAARARFESAIARCDNDGYARTGLGYVALREGSTDEAAALFERVTDVEPNNVDALVGVGLAAWRRGELEEVRRTFDRVLVLVPDHPTALEYLARLDTGTGAGAAEEAWASGDTDRALDLYSARLDRDPADGMALLRVGQIRSWRQEYGPALELLDRLIDLEPSNRDARLARARVYAWSGDVQRGIREVENVLAATPGNSDALATLALFQGWAGDTDAAFATYDELMSIAPEHATGRRQMAAAKAWATRSDEAIAVYESLLADNPEDIEARIGLATTLGFAGRYRRSVAEFDAVLARVPRDMRALTGKARSQMWSGGLVEAEHTVLGAVALNDTSAAAWSALGEVYSAQSRDAEALEALRAASRLAPGSADIANQLRAVETLMAPEVQPTFTVEDDSDGNRMVTSRASGGWHVTPRLEVRARAWHRMLEQKSPSILLEHTGYGGMVTAETQLRPGWRLRGGLGGTFTDGDGSPAFLAFEAAVRTPDRNRLGFELDVTSLGLDETAALARRGVRASDAVLKVRWFPDSRWRLDGSASLGRYEGDEANGRRGWFVGASRRLGRSLSLGVSHRGFSFEKNLDEGYFDPDYYGIMELTGYWLHRPAPWTFLVEVAPGVQQVGSDGDPAASFRSNARVGYLFGRAREVSLAFRYSTAGLSNFASGESGYRYLSLALGVTWVM